MNEMSETMKYHLGGSNPTWYRSAEELGHYQILLSFLHGLTMGIMAYAWWKDGEQHVGTCGTTLKEAMAVVEVEVARIEAMRDDA